MIYCDGVHVAADSLAELHEWAEKNGIKRCWFHRGDHYDLPKRIRGTIPFDTVGVDSRRIVEVIRNLRAQMKERKNRKPKLKCPFCDYEQEKKSDYEKYREGWDLIFNKKKKKRSK